jgi:hypothetical protein
MTSDNDNLSRQTAEVIGETVERTISFFFDELEDLSLWMMEQAASAETGNRGLTEVGRTLHSLQRISKEVPPLVGRFVAGSTLVGFRFGGSAIKATQRILIGMSESEPNEVEPEKDEN